MLAKELIKKFYLREKCGRKNTKVVVLKAEKINEERLFKGIDTIGGIPNVDEYTIKVNLCAIAPPPITTDVNLVKHIVDYVRYVNPKSKISIVESDATALDADKAFEKLGYRKLEKEYDNLKNINLSKDEQIRVELDGNIVDTLSVPMTLYDSECLIDLAQLKTHLFTGVSLGIKNLYGLIPNKNKEILHPFINDILVDLLSFYKVDLTILDGIQGLEGRGPTDGEFIRRNVLFFGNDVLATDIVATGYMGMNCDKVKHLSLCEKKIGKRDINICGDTEMLKNTVPFKVINRKAVLLINWGFMISRVGRYISFFGDNISFSGNVLAAVDKEVIEQKINYHDAFKILFKRSKKINI